VREKAMTLTRAGFLKSLALGAGGLIVGEEALERYARLTHVRKTFPSAGHFSQEFTLPLVGGGANIPASPIHIRNPMKRFIVVAGHRSLAEMRAL